MRALKEADNWTTLSTEREDALDNGDLSLVSSKLSAIQNSLKILSHVQDYDSRVRKSLLIIDSLEVNYAGAGNPC